MEPLHVSFAQWWCFLVCSGYKSFPSQRCADVVQDCRTPWTTMWWTILPRSRQLHGKLLASQTSWWVNQTWDMWWQPLWNYLKMIRLFDWLICTLCNGTSLITWVTLLLMVGWSWLVEWKECELKLSWHILTYSPKIYLGGLWKSIIQLNIQAEIWTQSLPNKRHANNKTTTYGRYD